MLLYGRFRGFQSRIHNLFLCNGNRVWNGVKQGALLSCLLFVFYVDIMVKKIRSYGSDGFLGLLHSMLLINDSIHEPASLRTKNHLTTRLLQWIRYGSKCGTPDSDGYLHHHKSKGCIQNALLRINPELTVHAMYDSRIPDSLRMKATRFRLSSHRLKVETGRLTRPITPQEQRLCNCGEAIQEKSIVLFRYILSDHIRVKHSITDTDMPGLFDMDCLKMCKYVSGTLTLYNA